MIEFMAALYNEEDQVYDLLTHVMRYVNRIVLVDDGSTDMTTHEVWRRQHNTSDGPSYKYKVIKHTGLPETVKAEALKLCDPNSWVIMLDADERFAEGGLDKITNFVHSPASENFTHVWFPLHEYINGVYSGRSFLKCRLFKASAAHFPVDTVHTSDWFDGNGTNLDIVVIHSKSAEKQVRREKEYIETYKKLVAEGKMTEQKMRENIGYHYFVRE